MTSTTFAQQAAASARKGDYDNASALYNRAANEAERNHEFAKGKRHRDKANHFERMAEKSVRA
jgi:hypothetical protein